MKKSKIPAFPVHLEHGENYSEHLPRDGMTLRDYFAAKAMQSMIVSASADYWRQIPERSYEFADAMLKARE